MTASASRLNIFFTVQCVTCVQSVCNATMPTKFVFSWWSLQQCQITHTTTESNNRHSKLLKSSQAFKSFLPAISIFHLNHHYSILFKAVIIANDVGMIKHSQHMNLQTCTYLNASIQKCNDICITQINILLLFPLYTINLQKMSVTAVFIMQQQQLKK